MDSQYNFLDFSNTSYDNVEHRLTIMLDNFNPLSNSTSALLEFWIWSDAGYLSYALAMESPMIVQNLTTILTKQRLTFQSEKSLTYLDNVNHYCLIQKKCSPISMTVSIQLTYSHGYFMKFPHTCCLSLSFIWDSKSSMKLK